MATETQAILPLSLSDNTSVSDERTMVIKAEEAQFHVHTDVLVCCSEVLRNMLTLPQPADAESVEGSSVVRIEGTSAEDMRLLIACISGSTDYTQILSNNARIAELLRNTTKFEMTVVRRDICHALSPRFPSTLLGYIDAPATDDTPLSGCVALVNAFRETRLLHFLPSTLYRICRASVRDILHSALSPVNLRAVLLGRAQLAVRARDVFPTVFGRRSGCAIHGAMPALAVALLAEDGWIDPLCERDITCLVGTSCKRCIRRTQAAYDEGRLAVWETLPEIFELPPWEKLRTYDQSIDALWYASHHFQF